MSTTVESPEKTIQSSPLISRDLSWLDFNQRVLDQSRKEHRTIWEKLKFLAITASNLDEFFMIRVGSLYNYLDYGKERTDFSGLRERAFKKLLYSTVQRFHRSQLELFASHLSPQFAENNFAIKRVAQLAPAHKEQVKRYFASTVFPMLTPMLYDGYHTFPILRNTLITLGVTTYEKNKSKETLRVSFIQVPSNLPRFYELEEGDQVVFVPIEDVISAHINHLFRNVKIKSVGIFRLTRNGDFTLEESDDIEANFLGELKQKLKTRRTGRVVRLETQGELDPRLRRLLMHRWELEDDNLFELPADGLMDYTALWQIIKHPDFKDLSPKPPAPVPPIALGDKEGDLFEVLKNQDVLLHHPYNSMEPVLELLEQAAEDPSVLSIKLTIYRLAKDSRVIDALLRAAENGKHVAALFEVKARFDEENNIRQAERLQKAGCFVVYGVSNLKTHTKLLLIVRKEDDEVVRYVHLSSGNYNEDTSRLYTDLGLLSTNEQYAQDVSEFFNALTGHSQPSTYSSLLTAPDHMRNQLMKLMEQEAAHARSGRQAGIVIKVNSLQDQEFIEKLYEASQANVPIRLIVRGICCLRPGRPGLSENITVRSIVGDFLEHSRLYYFHNDGNPVMFSGSADAMTRSFDRRLESLYKIVNPLLRQQCVNMLYRNLMDNVNSYELQEDASWVANVPGDNEPFDIHRAFFGVTRQSMEEAKLF